jgi:glycolate oxidase
MDTIIKELKEQINGTVLHEDTDLKRYRRDQSIYEIQPKCVVLPSSVEDLSKTIELSLDAKIPITPRGGGSGTAGAGLGEGIVIAFGKKEAMTHIVKFDDSKTSPLITVESGAIHDRVQDFLKARGLYLPADPSSGSFCQIGGNIATKASGPHALRHGSIDRYLKHLKFVSNLGEVVDTADESTIPKRMINKLQQLKESIARDEITVKRLRERKNKKIASGYNLFALIEDLPMGELVAQVLVGSIGTLGVVTEATLRTEPYIDGKATVVLPFENLNEAGDAVQYIRDLGVAAIEIISSSTVQMVRTRKNQSFGTLPPDAHLLLVELEGEERFKQIDSVKKIVSDHNYNLKSKPFVAMDEPTQAALWKDRKQLLPAIMNFQPHFKALSVVNDIGIDTQHLANVILDIETVFKKHGLVGAIYGHAGSGNLHLRPVFDIRQPDLTDLIQRLADDVYEVVFRYDGTITAEHGMGRLRAPYLEAEWGETIVRYMRQLKEIFDPSDMLNPGVMFSSRPITEGFRI